MANSLMDRIKAWMMPPLDPDAPQPPSPWMSLTSSKDDDKSSAGTGMQNIDKQKAKQVQNSFKSSR